MILPMTRLRILGPRDCLEPTLDAVQDVGVLHLAPPREDEGCTPVVHTPDQAAEIEALEEARTDLAFLHDRLGSTALDRPEDLAGWPALASDLRAELEALDDRARALDEERALLTRYRDVIRGFQPLVERALHDPDLRAHYLVVADGGSVPELRRALAEAVGDEIELLTRELEGGGRAVAVVAPAAGAEALDRLLAESPLQDLPVPEDYAGDSPSEVLAHMAERLEALPEERAAVEAEHAVFAADHGDAVAGALAAAHDRLAELAAIPSAATTHRAFVLEGWAPQDAVDRLIDHLEERLGPSVAVEEVPDAEAPAQPTPVELRNPPLFRPFETLTRLLPLPAYGTLDPTPFVAISFPMLFGIILGDIGYGLLLGGLALLLRRRTEPGSTGRSIAAIAGSSALFTIVFGALYGELLGDLGHHWLGLEPLLLAREEALLPALVLALGIGVVHIVLGLVLGAISAARGEPRKAVGRGLAAAMVVLVVVGLLAVLEVLPGALFTPALVAILIAFPLLVIAEGIIAPIEFLSTLANILSYARIMAVGTASVMMAVVANRLVGAVGSVLVGILFALLFHLVNFVIGVFGPAVHVLRLHYVEFFGKFHHPGGVPWRPLRRWDPSRPPPRAA